MIGKIKRAAGAWPVLCCTSAITAVFGFSPAAAQTAPAASTVQTITVTAEKRSENIQKVGMSISAFSGSELDRSNISSVAELTGYVPSLNIGQANNNRNTEIAIRNVGTAGTNPGTEADVGIFIDNVYIPEAGPIYGDLADISTVEVLRGPQGTLYGRNTPVGAINITTRAPSQPFEGMIDAQYGNYGQVGVKGYVGGGITDDLAGRLSFWSSSNSGYMYNLYNDTRVDSQNQYGARLRLRWAPDADTTVDLIGYYGVIHAQNNSGEQVDPQPGGIVFGYSPTPTSFATSPFVVAAAATNPLHPFVVTGPWQVNSATDAPDDTTTWGVSLAASRDLHPLGATLTNILAYNSYLDNNPNQGSGGLPLPLLQNLQRDFSRSASDEVRLVSDGTHFINYVAGLYLFHNDLDYDSVQTVQTGANRLFPASSGGGKLSPGDHSALDFGQYTNSIAVYGQATVNITSRLRAIGGLRYSYDHKGSSIGQTVSNVVTGVVSPAYLKQNGSGSSLSGRITNDSVTYTVGPQFDLTRDIMLYATMSSGFKDGGFNSRSATLLPYAYAPETSLNYEAGAKTAWFDHKLIVNVDVFRMLVHGYQQSTFLPTGRGFVINNAGNYRDQGVEAEFQAHPIEPLSLTGAISYVDSKATSGADHLQCDTSYLVAGSVPPPSSGPYTDATHTVCNYNGLTPADSPKWQWSLQARWEQPLASTPFNWFVSGRVTGISSQYLYALLDPRSFQPGYALVNAFLGVETNDGGWRVQLWGKNLGNVNYYLATAPQTQAAYISGGGTKAANGYIGWPGDPRTFGIEVTHKF